MFATIAGVAASQRTLLGTGEPRVDPDAPSERIRLDDESWIDVVRNWLLGADTLLDALIESVDWKQGRRHMYERMVDDPRLFALGTRAANRGRTPRWTRWPRRSRPAWVRRSRPSL